MHTPRSWWYKAQHLLNRALLTLDFFKVTRVSGDIFRASVTFDYVDGDQSPHEKGAYGVWGEWYVPVWMRLRRERGMSPAGVGPSDAGSDPSAHASERD